MDAGSCAAASCAYAVRTQARHLAVVVDSTDALWAPAPNGSDWDAAVAADPLFTALVKGFIRHDLDVQQIYADFPEELRSHYGPGLQQLRRSADSTDLTRGTSRAPNRRSRSVRPARRIRSGSRRRRRRGWRRA
jgi:hypothetical protein